MRKTLFLAALLAASLPLLSGCDDTSFLGMYRAVVQAAGDLALTGADALQGERAFGVDHYTGRYEARYDLFTGKETLFGGIDLNRAAGDALHVRAELSCEDGQATLMFTSSGAEPTALLSGPGVYEGDLTLPDAGNYLVLEAVGLTGQLTLEAK